MYLNLTNVTTTCRSGLFYLRFHVKAAQWKSVYNYVKAKASIYNCVGNRGEANYYFHFIRLFN